VTLKRHVPTIGIAVALALFALAARSYPGGTTDSPNTIGYSWAHNFVSSLFAPRALNGAPNPARSFSVAAMLALCGSLAIMFRRLSRQFRSRLHQKTIEIGGIGAMVYDFLVVTPMHDLMVNIGLLFSFAALLATTHALYLERRWLLVLWGLSCIALAGISATMYYGHRFYGLLPVVQKVFFLACVGWIVSAYYTQSVNHRLRSATPPLSQRLANER
jgi:hypothetical protein